MNTKTIVQELQSNLSRDMARLHEVDGLRERLLRPGPRRDDRDVAAGIRLRVERRMLEERICRTKILLADARRVSGE